MKPTRLSPIDVLGITLGTIVLLVVIASIALIAQGRLASYAWRGSDREGHGHGRWSGQGSLREEQDQQVDGIFTAVEIRNVAGAIEVRAGSGDSVGIHSVKTAMFPGAMDNLSVGIEKQGTRLLVEERHAGFWSAGAISFDITVPKGVKLITAHSVSGSITVRDVPAGIDQNLSTVSGSISTSRAANLEASSTSGSIVFTFAGSRLAANTISGSVEGRVESLQPNGTVTIHTVSGSVDMAAFPGLDAGVSLHSLSGGVSCDFPVVATEQKRNSLEGKIGSGAGKMEINTTSGPITVRKL